MANVEYPDNPLTRMMENIAADNRAGGGRRYSVSSAEPMPAVRSADVGQEVERPLSPEEIAELNAMAAAAGVKDERLGNVDAPSGGAYASLEDALAEGAPVAPPIVHHPVGMRAPANRVLVPAQPRLPNFRNVEGIDLLRNRVLIDGMEFPINEPDALEFKRYVVETAREAILAKLTEADDLFSVETPEETNGGTTAEQGSTVQQLAEGSGEESPR